jgi:hypothetical protein
MPAEELLGITILKRGIDNLVDDLRQLQTQPAAKSGSIAETGMLDLKK